MKGEKKFVAVGNSSQFTHKGHLKTKSQPQRRSSLKADASWNESSLWPWNRPVPQRPFLSPARSLVPKAIVWVTLELPDNWEPWGLLWELQDLNCSSGLGVSLSGMTKKSSGRLEQLQEGDSHWPHIHWQIHGSAKTALTSWAVGMRRCLPGLAKVTLSFHQHWHLPSLPPPVSDFHV